MSVDESTTRLMKTIAATVFMLVIGWLVAPRLSSWHSHQLAARLVARIASAEDAQVKVPLRQLADLGEAAIEPLIVAAASQRTAVATIARQIVDEKLATWELLAAESPSNDIATLAIALAAHVEEFGPAGKQWAERLALTMIELTDSFPAQQTQVLLEQSSRILAAVPPRGPRLRTLSAGTEITASPAAARLAAPEPKLQSLTRASEGALEVFARLRPTVPPEAFGRLRREVSLGRRVGDSLSKPFASADLHWSTQKNSESRPKSSPTTHVAPQNKLQIVPRPADTLSNDVIDVPNPQNMATSAATLGQLPSDELLFRLRKANFFEAGIIRSVLVERGFDDAELALRQQMTSPNVADRLQLVEEVSQLPAIAARRMLRWLLDDASGDVRLRALTALATTNSPDLGKLARELAVRDEDPRVVKLASRLLRQSR